MTSEWGTDNGTSEEGLTIHDARGGTNNMTSEEELTI